MLVSQYLIEKYKNKRYRDGHEDGSKAGEERGIKAGREERQRQWEEWNRRRMEAEAANRPFTEPPPGQN